MKKYLRGIKVIVVLVLLLGVFSPLLNVSAASPERTVSPQKMEKDYKEMMGVIKRNVISGKSEETIAKLPEVVEFQKKYTQEQIQLYLASKVEGFKKGKVAVDENQVELEENETKIIDYPDGSFSVMSSKIEPVTTPTTETASDNMIMPMASYTDPVGSSWKVTYTKEFWGIYLACRAVLITYYTINRSNIHIYDTDDAGSKAYMPTSMLLRGTKDVTNNAMTVESKGSYQKVNGVVIGSQPIGFSHSFTLRTKIKITSSTSSKVNYTVTHTYVG